MDVNIYMSEGTKQYKEVPPRCTVRSKYAEDSNMVVSPKPCSAV